MPRLWGQSDSTLEVRGTIISMWEAGVPKHEISDRVDLSVSMCYEYTINIIH